MIDLRVLVVDDNDSFRGLMATHLSRSGYRVDMAVDGLEALELIRRAPGTYAVMVTDLMMPRLNGLELVREARHVDPQLQVVVITAATTLEMAIAALQLFADIANSGRLDIDSQDERRVLPIGHVNGYAIALTIDRSKLRTVK